MLALVGILVVVVGFALRINPLLVVVVSAIVTGVAAHHGLVDVIAAFGKAFVDSRSVAVVWMALPVISMKSSSAETVRLMPLLSSSRLMASAVRDWVP